MTPNIEDRLLQALEREPELAPPNDRHTSLDTWVAVSALQKATRRGDTETALRATQMLLDYAPDRFWSRLVVIAMEDIGIAELDLVGQVLWVSGKQAWRREHGGDWRTASNLVKRLCGSVKCRDACDLLVIADLHADYADARQEFAIADERRLSEILASTDLPIGVRAVAAWYLAGTRRFPALNLLGREGSFKALLDVYEHLGVPSDVLEVARLGSTRTREAHAVTLPLIWLMADASDTVQTTHEQIIDMGMVNGWPSAAYDMHTRYGKRAISYFIKACAEVRKYLHGYVPDAELHELIGSIVFRLEGENVDRRFLYAVSSDLLHQAENAHLCWGSLPAYAVQTALQIVQNHLHVLHKARRRVMS